MSGSLFDQDVSTVPAMVDSATLLATLKSWSEQGWLRRLDSAFAGFMVELDAAAAAPVVLAAALVAHMESRGHACLLLDELLQDADGLLGWAPAAAVALHEVMDGLPRDAKRWRDALRASPLVWPDDAAWTSNTPARRNAPLVLRGDKLYLRRYWGYERRIASQVQQRGAAPITLDRAAVRDQLDLLFPAAAGMAAEGGSGTDAFIDWQKIACAVALRGRLSIITGGPGTGKTYTAARLLALLFAIDSKPERLRVALAAPTGKAAARLKQSIDTALGALADQLGDTVPLRELAARIAPARTLHALLGARPDTRSFRFDAANLLEVDVLIVDEASMVHLEMMAALLEALPPQARVIFLGDKDQLASVEAGAVLGDLCRDANAGRYSTASAAFIEAATGQTVPVDYLAGPQQEAPALAQQTVMLRHSHRFGGPIGQLALAVNAGDANRASVLLRSGSGAELNWADAPSPAAVLRLALHGRQGAEGGYASYLRAMAVRPRVLDRDSHPVWVHTVLTAFERFRLLCAVREGDWGAAGLNLTVERALVAEGLLTKRGEWYEGRPVMVTRNDREVGVFNGDIGIVLRGVTAGGAGAAGGTGTAGASGASATALRAYFMDGDAVRSVSVSRLADVETAFAMTVHKSQGSEFEHTVLVLPRESSRVLTRELVYTGITRARKAFTLVTGRVPAFADALAHRTRRASGLLELLG